MTSTTKHRRPTLSTRSPRPVEGRASPVSARVVLERILAERKRRNPAYSLRAFAHQLGVSAATLSQVLSGKRPLTERSARHMALALGLAPDETKAFVAGARPRRRPFSSGLSPADEAIVAEVARVEREILEAETFRVISDWPHFALLSLSEIASHQADPHWLARRLGLSPSVVRQAVARLIRLGLLEEAEGKLRQTSRPLETRPDHASQAVRNFFHQTLAKAGESLDRDDVSLREFGAVTMAINTDTLPKAKELIRKFKHDLAALLEQGPRERVYTLAIQLFPLDLTQHSSPEGSSS